MTAALVLAIMLVVVVAVLALAVNAQGQVPRTQHAGAPRERRSRPSGSPSAPKQPRRPQRDRASRASAEPPGDAPGEAELAKDSEQAFSDLRPLNKRASAVILGVVDERVLGPVTRCRLTLRVEPGEGAPFEVTTRVAFPTPEARGRAKVGSTVPVRYDSEDHRRVVVEMEGRDEG